MIPLPPSFLQEEEEEDLSPPRKHTRKGKAKAKATTNDDTSRPPSPSLNIIPDRNLRVIHPPPPLDISDDLTSLRMTLTPQLSLDALDDEPALPHIHQSVSPIIPELWDLSPLTDLEHDEYHPSACTVTWVNGATTLLPWIDSESIPRQNTLANVSFNSISKSKI